MLYSCALETAVQDRGSVEQGKA